MIGVSGANLADRLEQRVGRDVGRNISALVSHARGGLGRAAGALERAGAVTLITGFYIPGANPPAPETDGPIGAALLAGTLVDRGVPVRVVTDHPCAPVVRAALVAADLDRSITLDVVATASFEEGEAIDAVFARHAAAPASHVVSIERCGPGAGGAPRNARGENIAAHTAPLERFFTPPAYRIGIGDGGNELGMGSIPPEIIAADVAHGAAVACRVPADALIVAGVANWGAAALALLVGGADAARRVNGAAHDRLLDAICAAGAVDGVRRVASRSGDDLDADVHRDLIDALVAEARA